MLLIRTWDGCAISVQILTSVKILLGSTIIPKVIFDIRNDSDALFSHYRISVNSIQDLQLMELAIREGSVGNKKFVAGLVKCIEPDSVVSASAKAGWKWAKDNAMELIRPEDGGRYKIFNERPMRPKIIQYCAEDAALLPGLYEVYNANSSHSDWLRCREPRTIKLISRRARTMLDRP